MRKKRPRVLVWRVCCKRDIVKKSYRELDWYSCTKTDVKINQWDLAWADSPGALFKEVSLGHVHMHQRLNHFPGMQLLCRKDLLAGNLQELKKALRAQGSSTSFSFLPPTWIFPSEAQNFWGAVARHFRAEEKALTPQVRKARARRLRRKARQAQDDSNAKTRSGTKQSSTASALDAGGSDSDDEPQEVDELEPFTCIAKPQDGCQGKGIVMFQLQSDYKSASETNRTRRLMEEWKQKRIVVQKFVSRPLLVDSFKWDMRVYVLVTNLEPLKVYLYDDGLARFCTHTYEPPGEHNLEETEMHLTNFSINWNSEAFIDTDADDTGSKRSLAAVLASVLGKDAVETWQAIAMAVTQTLLAFTPKLRHVYQSYFGHLRRPELADAGAALSSVCFELLGFDFLLDEERKLYLLEVNSGPSWGTDTTLDERVKGEVLRESFSLLGLDPTAKFASKKLYKKLLQARQDDHLKRREELVRSKGEKSDVGFLSTLARDGEGSFLPGDSHSTAAGSPMWAVRNRRKVHTEQARGKSKDFATSWNETKFGRGGNNSYGSNATSSTADESQMDEFLTEGGGEDNEIEEEEEEEEEEEGEDDYEKEQDSNSLDGPVPTRFMDGVGPYVTPHFVHLLPSKLVPDHDAIIASAEMLMAR